MNWELELILLLHYECVIDFFLGLIVMQDFLGTAFNKCMMLDWLVVCWYY